MADSGARWPDDTVGRRHVGLRMTCLLSLNVYLCH